MTLKFSICLALAMHYDMDDKEVKEYRYQSTRTPCPVYTLDDDYVTATSGKVPTGNHDYTWEPVKSWITAAYGWRIWRKKDDED